MIQTAQNLLTDLHAANKHPLKITNFFILGPAKLEKKISVVYALGH